VLFPDFYRAEAKGYEVTNGHQARSHPGDHDDPDQHTLRQNYHCEETGKQKAKNARVKEYHGPIQPFHLLYLHVNDFGEDLLFLMQSRYFGIQGNEYIGSRHDNQADPWDDGNGDVPLHDVNNFWQPSPNT
jgi:hypothetical protein